PLVIGSRKPLGQVSNLSGHRERGRDRLETCRTHRAVGTPTATRLRCCLTWLPDLTDGHVSMRCRVDMAKKSGGKKWPTDIRIQPAIFFALHFFSIFLFHPDDVHSDLT
ncbi:MAG TPA: hypothetical protein VGH74_06155, partial [Planctomycetaceae bacterium]